MAEIKAVLIFEMLGRPKEHLQETMVQFIDRISKEEGVTITKKEFNEPKKIEEAKQELYSTFSEIEADFKNLIYMMRIIFTYLPSHIEIVYPSELTLKNQDMNTLMNEIITRLHQYDELAKRLVIEKNILQNQLKEATSKNQPTTKEKPQKNRKKKSA